MVPRRLPSTVPIRPPSAPLSDYSSRQSCLHLFSFSSSWTHGISSLPNPTSTQAGPCDWHWPMKREWRCYASFPRWCIQLSVPDSAATPDPCSDPGSTRGDEAFISLGPWLITRSRAPIKPTLDRQQEWETNHCALKPLRFEGLFVTLA